MPVEKRNLRGRRRAKGFICRSLRCGRDGKKGASSAAIPLKPTEGLNGALKRSSAKKAGHLECAPNSVKLRLGRNAITCTAGTLRRSLRQTIQILIGGNAASG